MLVDGRSSAIDNGGIQCSSHDQAFWMGAEDVRADRCKARGGAQADVEV